VVLWTIRSCRRTTAETCAHVREAGATEVHMRISCRRRFTVLLRRGYAHREELIASANSPEEIRKTWARFAGIPVDAGLKQAVMTPRRLLHFVLHGVYPTTWCNWKCVKRGATKWPKR